MIIQDHHYMNIVCFNRVMLFIILKRYTQITAHILSGYVFQSCLLKSFHLPFLLRLDSFMTYWLYSLARNICDNCYPTLSDSSFECCHIWLMEISTPDLYVTVLQSMPSIWDINLLKSFNINKHTEELQEYFSNSELCPIMKSTYWD